jgi:hypothetical protein
MHYRFANLTALALFFAAVTHASAQGPVRERAAVFEAVVAHLADHLELRLDQVLVDTVRSGRALSGGRGRPHDQQVEVQEMRDAAQRLGFRLGTPAGISACFMPPGVTDEPCQLEETGVGLVINAPAIAGASANVTFMSYLRHPRGNRREFMLARLLWREGTWQVTEVRRTTLEEEVPLGPGGQASSRYGAVRRYQSMMAGSRGAPTRAGSRMSASTWSISRGAPAVRRSKPASVTR